MKIKICGLRHPDEVMTLAALPVDYVGFVFQASSPRCATGVLDPEAVRFLPKTMKKVGVFVEEETEIILDHVLRYQLDLVQLHGTASPEQCALLRGQVMVMKAFSVPEDFSFEEELLPYAEAVDFFLFDAKGERYGGNGIPFDWELLLRYNLDIPFFIAGGIGPQHAPDVLRFQHPAFHAFDLNSRFEFSPGRKNLAALRGFLSAVKPSSHALRGY